MTGSWPLRVWAPGHRSVEIVTDGGRIPMAQAAGPEGWWEGELPGGHGARYRLSVDGGEPRPDPRSAWQPDGVEGPSAVVDHARFAWSDHGWKGARLASSPIYELHIGTFTPEGTFDAAVGRLDHLVELGIGAIEVLPVAEFPGRRGWGYDGVLLWAPHHAYGGPDGLKRLVDAAHQRGLAVILDVVYNHLGPAGNYLGEYGPYFTDRYRTPWGAAVNVDGAGSDGVRRFIIDNALMWLGDYHIDGLRLDAVHAIIDQSALHVLEELAIAVDVLADRTGRQRWLIAESDRNDPRLVRSREAGGYGLDATWSDEFHHALHSVLTGERDGYYEDFGRLDQVARAVEGAWVYGRDWSPFRRRHHGLPAGDLDGDHFVVCLQNHDQIGNRAVGDRLAALVSPGRLAVGAAILLTSRYVPMLFQGEEWAASTPWQYFTDHQDPELADAVREGRRHEFEAFGWDPEQVPDPQDEATLERSALRWDELDSGHHAAILEWHRTLLRLRREVADLADLRREAVAVRCSDEAGWLVIERGSVSVVANLGDAEAAVPVRPGGQRLAAWGEVAVEDASVRLPPDTVVILRHG